MSQDRIQHLAEKFGTWLQRSTLVQRGAEGTHLGLLPALPFRVLACANRNRRSASEETVIATTATARRGDSVCIRQEGCRFIAAGFGSNANGWRLLCPCLSRFPVPKWAALAVACQPRILWSWVTNPDLQIGNWKLFLLKTLQHLGLRPFSTQTNALAPSSRLPGKESTPQLETEQTAGKGGGDGHLASYHCPQRKHPWSCGSAVLQGKHKVCIAEYCHRIRISHFKNNRQLSPKFILSTSALPWCSCSSSS